MVRWTWLFLDLPDGRADEGLRFWAAVTGSTPSPWRGDHDEFTTLVPPAGDPWLKVQRVGGPGGVHLDLDVTEAPAEAAGRAVGLGASVDHRIDDVVVCRSPGGLPFCLAPAGREGGPRQQARAGAGSLLDQVCLDIPAGRYREEVEFWSAVTGWAVEPGAVRDEFERLAVPAELPLEVLLQRLDDDDGPVRAHADLASRDRPSEVARHVALGAQVTGEGREWTVLTGPGGLVHCVTDRWPMAEPSPS